MFVFVCSPDLWKYRRGGKHPAQPDRLRRSTELISAYHLFERPDVTVLCPREADPHELTRFHTPDYVAAVRALSDLQEPLLPDGTTPQSYGFRTGDNPVYEGMYHAAALRVGGGLMAADLLARGEAKAVFHFAGGQHHARPDRTSGFCIFNDPVITIQALRAEGMRVAYVDTDAHHGDGVQQAFYNDDRVLTISIHESGKYLYPRTGQVEECGEGPGLGYSLNMPLAPGTGDDVYLYAFRQVVPGALQAFRPDVLVTVFGADAHRLDPLSHLGLSTKAYVRIARCYRELSPGRWLALGGGGYRDAAVPRIWTLMWAEMISTSDAASDELCDELPVEYREKYRDGERLRDPFFQSDEEAQRRAHEEVERGIEYLRAHTILSNRPSGSRT